MVYVVLGFGLVASVVVVLLALRGGLIPDESLCMAPIGEGDRCCESRMRRVRGMGWLSSGAHLFRCSRGHAWILRPALFGWTVSRWSNEDCSPGAEGPSTVSRAETVGLHDPVGSMQ